MNASLASLLVAAGTLAACAREAPAPETMPLQGHYVWGAEVMAFTPCGSESDYWVVGSRELTSELARRYETYGLEPYEPVFVRLVGTLGPPLDDGFAADYDGSVRVDSLLWMGPASPDSHCRAAISYIADVPRGAADTIFRATTLDTLRDASGASWLLLSGVQCAECDAPETLYLRPLGDGRQLGPYGSAGEHFQLGVDEGPPEARSRVFAGDCLSLPGDELVALEEEREATGTWKRSAYIVRMPDAGSDAGWTTELEDEVMAAVAAGRCTELPRGTHYY